MVMTLLTRPKKTVGTVVIATDGSGDFNTNGTDDQVEIQAAIDSLPAGGGCVYMKEGTYTITATITITIDNVAIIGCGRCTHITITTDDINLLEVGTNIEGILITNMRFSGVGGFGGVTHSAIYFDTVDNSEIRGVWVDNCTDVSAAGIVLDNSPRNIIISCKVNGNRFNLGIGTSNYNIISNSQFNSATGGSGIRIVDSQYNLIEGNECLSNTTGLAAIYFENSDNNIVIDNILFATSEGNGLYLEGIGNLVTNNIITENGDDGITITGSWNSIIGNYIRTNTRSAILVWTNGEYNTVSNNDCHANEEYGIRIRSGSHHTTITGNHTFQNEYDGILIESDDNIISNNINDTNDVDNTTTYSGIRLISADRNIISNNRCKENDNYEIDISNATCNDNLVEGNICIGTNHVGTINDSGTNTHLAHNITT